MNAADILHILFYALVLLFGISLSFAFSGVTFNRKSLIVMAGLYLICGIAQIILYFEVEESLIWKIYPFIVHLPLFLVLILIFHKRLSTSLAAISSAYLFCQPARWLSLLSFSLTDSCLFMQSVRVVILSVSGIIGFFFLSEYMSHVFSKRNRDVYILSGIPLVYYLYDYGIEIYGHLWISNYMVAVEFLPFFLCLVYICFCVIYYKQYEQRTEAEQNEHLIRFAIEQQTRELEAIQRSEQETMILRHDMRLLLNNLSICLEKDPEAAKKMIDSYADRVDSSTVKRYCSNHVINSVLANYSSQCQAAGVNFRITVQIGRLNIDEIIFSLIISNALDNALNAQKQLRPEKRWIEMMLKNSNDRLLLSIKNPYAAEPVFVDGVPVSQQKNHGYGVKSIQCMTERLQGKCLFSIEKHQFVFRFIY